MKTKLTFLLVFLFMALSVCAETPSEAHRKHPNSLCMFTHSPASSGTLKGFDIERVAFDTKKRKVAIKLKQNTKDIVKTIKTAETTDDYALAITFTDGSGIAVHSNGALITYISTKGEMALYVIDLERGAEYDKITEKYSKYAD